MAVQVIDGQPELPFPAEIDAADMEQNRLMLTQQHELNFSDDLGKLDTTIEQVKMGDQNVMYFVGNSDQGPRIMQYIGVIDDRRKIVSCVSMQGNDVPECHSRAEELFGPKEGGIDG